MMELFTMIAFFHSKGVTNLSLCQILKYCMTCPWYTILVLQVHIHLWNIVHF